MLLFRALVSVLLAQATYALTPVGQTAKGQKVYTAPMGSRIKQSGRDMEVFAPNGSLIHTFANVIPMGGTKPKRQILSTTELVAQFNVTPSDTIESFTTSFVVPPAPEVFDSQIIFMSANIRVFDPLTGLVYATLRPTLQYGGSWLQGGSFYTWAMQLEFADQVIVQLFATDDTDLTLEVGRTLDSTIFRDHKLEQQSPGSFWYTGSFPSVTNISVVSVGWDFLPSTITFQLEEEGVFQPGHYPKGSLVFENINVNLTSGPPKMSWQPNVDPATQVEFKVDVDGPKDGKVELVFASNT